MTQRYIKIHSGNYRGQAVVNQVFPLVAQYKVGAKGGFVTVDGTELFGEGRDKIRVKVDGIKSYEFVGDHVTVDSETVNVKAAGPAETDEEAMKRIAERFDILTEMTTACIAGDVRAMIVTGPPGVGKSFGVEQEIDKADTFDKIAGRGHRSAVVKGSATALGLYCTLYKYREPGSTVVFDDCDTVLFDEVSLNLLKGALDSGKKRRISWLSDSHMLRREDVPDSFDFKGSVIFITNLKFDAVKSKKIGDHLAALQSRCHYLDLTIDTVRDKLLRIKQVALSGALFEDYGLDDAQVLEVVNFIEDNQKQMREISLRQAMKIADLMKSFPQKWQALARTTCMKTAA